MQPRVSPSHCSSASASGPHRQLQLGSGHLHQVHLAPWVPAPSLLTTSIQDVPATTGMCFCHKCPLHGSPCCHTEELGCISFCPWPCQGLVVLCFCSCCKLTAKVSLYTEYLQILIYICISFCYSIFICSGSTNDVFFLFTDATGQENDGGFVWPVGFVCVTVEDAGLY